WFRPWPNAINLGWNRCRYCVPKGQMRIAQKFISGKIRLNSPASPVGTIEKMQGEIKQFIPMISIMFFNRPYGTWG
ncbi:MAG: hypothetical protein ACREOI_33330, partial [bacterium]